MKVKIKGLVFVGFAAAILSANAMAAVTDASTVTSKAYTDATFQVKSTGVQVGQAEGGWKALDTSIGNDADNTTAPTTLAVKNYITGLNLGSTYQDRSESENAHMIADGEGGWEALNDGIVTDSYITTSTIASGDDAGKLNVVVNATTDEALSNVNTGAQTAGTNDGKLPTARAVKGYVDTTKQAKDNNQVYKVGYNGGWEAANTAVTAGTHIAKTDNNDGSVTINVDDITSAGNNIDSTDTGLTTGKAVYEYVDSKIHGLEIPNKGENCTDTTPCSLVAESDGVHWRVMATGAANQSPAAGTCGDATGQGCNASNSQNTEPEQTNP